MKLSEFFAKAGTKKIVINSDIDGFLSGMILQKYYGCEIVGFTNSKNSIWLTPEIASIYSPVYIDIFVNRPTTYSIDQHIVAYDDTQVRRLLAYGTKLNPNIDLSPRTYSGDLGETADYFHKYPFGTVHYLITLMKQDGIDVEFNDLSKEYSIKTVFGEYKTCPGQIILRADDALYSSLGPYEENAKTWWSHLSSFDSQTVRRLIAYMETCDKSRNSEYKREIGKFFVDGLNCDGIDGAFDTVTCYGSTTIQNRILRYNEKINEIIGIKMKLPEELVEHKGRSNVTRYSEEIYNLAITYAFVRGPRNPGVSFSYTIFDDI